MATSFGDLKSAIVRLLNDTPKRSDNIVGGTVYAPEALKDAVHAGLLAILPHVWKSAVQTIPAGTTVLSLPVDIYHVEGIYDEEYDSYLEESILTPGPPMASEAGNMWMEYPEGSLTFLAEMEDGGTLYYAAYWTKPELDTDIIEAPDVSLPGVAYYAASYCLLSKAVGNATIGQYDTRVDSGTPEDNPMMTMANHFMKRFELEMSRISSRAKGVR